MKPQVARFPKQAMLVLLVLLCVASPLLTACEPAPATPTRQPTTAPAAAPTRETTAVQPVAGRTAAPAVTHTVASTPLPAGDILLPTGGRLIVPEGALPADVEISMAPTCTPALHTNMTAVSTAVMIYAAQKPTRPLMLRIPVPEGITNTATLAIIRVEPNGATTFLMTEADGDELVAATPGYGTFVVLQSESSQAWVSLAGPSALVPGESAVYYPVSAEWQDVLCPQWSVAGGMALTAESAEVALVQALEGSLWADVTFEFVNRIRGWRWFGARLVQIDTGSEAYGGQPFKLSVLAETPLVTVGQDVKVIATAHGAFEPPLIWSWDFGDGETGGPVTTQGSTGSFALPAKRYDQHSWSAGYPVSVTVTDARSRQVRGQAAIRARAERTFWAEVEGPPQVSWISPEVEGLYTVSANGGEPPITNTVMISPQEDWRRSLNTSNDLTCSLQPLFREPGEYRLLSLVYYGSPPAGSAVAALPILVEGAQALRAELRKLPATARAGQQVSADVQVQGGALVVAGEKRGYTLQVDWGDGTRPLSTENEGEDKTSLEGTTVSASHTYSSAGKYTVRTQVCDATGWSTAATQEIVVVGTAAPVAGAPTFSAPPAVPTVQVPGSTVALATGGAVFVPEGALPSGAKINAAVTNMPALPEGVQAVGEALSITATAELALPVTLRLPVPAGVANAQDLVILRVEASGATAFLVTRVENKVLVAETFGFSTFVPVKNPHGLQAWVTGESVLLPNEASTYLLRLSDPQARVWTEWYVQKGPANVMYQNDWSAHVMAGKPGEVILYYQFFYPAAVAKWMGWYTIRVIDRDADAFRLGLLAVPPVAQIGKEKVRLIANAYGNVTPPIEWNWRFDGGGEGSVQTGAGVTQFELPESAYPSLDQPGIYHVHVWAGDQSGLDWAWGAYELREVEPLRIWLEEPSRIKWSWPRVNLTYKASASGGEPPYAYTFRLVPGPEQPRAGGGAGEDSATFWFDQPGEYRLEVTVVDGRDRKTTGRFWTVVESDEPLSTRILELPATAKVNDKITARIQARGGVLLTAGKKVGYRLKVDWGDGSAPWVQDNAGATTLPYTGTVVSLSHSYAQAKKYTVRLEASDATGNVDWYEQDILITAAPSAATPTAQPAQQPTARGTQLVWVRQGPAEFKYPQDAPWYEPNPLAERAGSFDKGTTSATRIVVEEKLVANRVQLYHLVFTANFDEPPQILVPGRQYKVRASVSHTGTNERGGEAPGIQASFVGDGYTIEPNEALRYYPFRSPPPASSKEWTLSAPQRVQPGATYWVEARTPSHPKLTLRWNYRAEYR